VASYLHHGGATGGYLSEIDVKRLSSRFISVGYNSGEFCNSIVFFDLEQKKTAGHLGCVANGYLCQAVSVSGPESCSASVDCHDQGVEGEPPSQPPVHRTIT